MESCPQEPPEKPEKKEQQGGRAAGALIRLISSLRFRLLVLIFLVVLPALALTLFTDTAWRRHETQDSNKLVLMLARLAARHQEQVIQGSHELLRALSQVSAMHRGNPACAQTLDALRGLFPSYANIGFIRLDGSGSCTISPAPGSADLRDHPLFWRVVETREFVLGGYQVDGATGKAVMHFAGPIFDGGGRIQAVGFGDLGLNWLADLKAELPLPAGVTVTLIDRDGVIAAREPVPEGWVGRSALEAPVFRESRKRSGGTTIGEDLDGVKKLFAFTPLRGPFSGGGLILAIALPVTSIFAESDNILARNLLALGGTGILVIMIAWAGVNFLVLRRMKALVGMARRLSAGDLTARSGVSHGAGELDQLADAFDSMAADLEKRQAETDKAREALRSSNDELERRVLERTADLAKANATLEDALCELRQTEQHLREDEAQLSAIIDSATDAIITIDANRRVLLFNRSAERIFQLPAAHITGQPAERLIPDRFHPALRHLIRGGAITSQCGSTGPVVGLRAGGEEFPIEAATSLVKVQGKTVCTIILRDITERRRREESLRKLSSAVEQTAESVYITDCRGLIEYVNPAFEQQTGYAREEAVGQTPRILKSGEHGKEFYEAMWKKMLSGQVFRDLFINKKKNGQVYYDLQTITPIRDDQGSISHFVASSRDVTHRVRTRRALERVNAQLEREAERIAHALHDEAGQFLTAAHIVLAEVARDLPPVAQQRLQEVREHLIHVEEQLRHLSRELRPRILDDLGLPAALEFLANGVTGRTGIGVTLEAHLDERLSPLIETTLYRLVQEALTNASRHAQAKRIRVRITREDQAIRCAIQDDGVGFNVPEIFDRKGDSSLGLIGIRDRLEALGGTLQIESVPGQGTEIIVLIPSEN
jgi:PAS domain S-box-containing protein